MCRNHIQKWQDRERRRPSGIGGRNEDHAPKNETYKFLGIEQIDGIRTKRVFERVKEE